MTPVDHLAPTALHRLSNIYRAVGQHVEGAHCHFQCCDSCLDAMVASFMDMSVLGENFVTGLFDYKGKVVVITGGSRGLGLEMVRAFAERGAKLVISSRKLDACEEAAREVRALGGEAIAVSAHAGRWEEVEQLVEKSYAAFSNVDILINNAGMSPAIPSHEVSEEMFDKIVSLNFKGPFRLSAMVAHRMAQGKGGVIINISSSGALIPLPTVVPYAGAKAALNAMTVSMAREYGPTVRVNSISAGPFLTDISKAWPEDHRHTADNSMRRPGLPKEIVSTVLYLASDASSFVTGAVVRCDGGMN